MLPYKVASPGEQEAVAQAAHDAGLMTVASRRAKRRHLRQSFVVTVILMVWLAYCMKLAFVWTDEIVGLAMGMKLYAPPVLYYLGHAHSGRSM